jgi:hypothetical protein
MHQLSMRNKPPTAVSPMTVTIPETSTASNLATQFETTDPNGDFEASIRFVFDCCRHKST